MIPFLPIITTPTPSEGTVIYSLISSPNGVTSPEISGNHITGMTVNGDYVVKAVYTREEKKFHGRMR